MCVRAKSSPTVLRAEFAAGRICVPNLRPRYFPVKYTDILAFGYIWVCIENLSAMYFGLRRIN